MYDLREQMSNGEMRRQLMPNIFNENTKTDKLQMNTLATLIQPNTNHETQNLRERGVPTEHYRS